MAYINKKDTNGTKPLLAEGELGYDKYVDGGDVGRVYVGTGSENIPLSQKEELDTHKLDEANPHSVTKAQVGLGNVDNESKATMFTSPTFTGTVAGVTKAMVGLGNADNTSDADKPVSTAKATAIGLKLDAAIANASHIGRADKYLAAQAIANMIYTSGNLTKIRYSNDTDVDYETLSYVDGNLTSMGHYVAGSLVGTTTLTYTNGSLVSVVYA